MRSPANAGWAIESIGLSPNGRKCDTSLYLPQAPACLRIPAAETGSVVADDLPHAVECSDDECRICSGVAGSFPKHLAGLAIERSERRGFRAGRDDEPVVHDQRRDRRAPVQTLRSEIGENIRPRG